MLRGLWHHIRHNLREGGWRQVFQKVLWRFHQWRQSDDSWLVYRIDLGRYSREPALLCEHRSLDVDTMREHQYPKAFTFPEAMQQRLNAGLTCNGFFLEGKLANIGWTSPRFLEMDQGVRIDDTDAVGIYDCYTFPDHRGKGVYPDTLIRMVNAAQAAGARRVLIAVDPNNIASIKGIERAGFEPLFQLTRNKRFGRARLHREPFTPRLDSSKVE